MNTHSEIIKRLELLESSVKRDPEDPNTWPEKEQIQFVREKWYNISNIKNPSEAVQIAAVQQHRFLLGYMKNPSEAVQLASLQKDGYAIRDIKNPSPFLSVLARVMKGEHISKHEMLSFVDEASQKSSQYPFLLNVLKERGWA